MSEGDGHMTATLAVADEQRLRALGEELLEWVKPPPVTLLITAPQDQYKRHTVEARRETDDKVLHTDCFSLKSAKKRKAFAKAVGKAAPDLTDVDELDGRLLELDEEDAPVDPKEALPVIIEEDLPTSAIIRAGSFITPTMAGVLLPRLVKRSVDGHALVLVRNEFVLCHKNGKRERTPFADTVTDEDGETFYIVCELPSLSPRTIRPGWRRDAQDRWLAGDTPEIADVRDRLAAVIAARVWLPEDVEDAVSLLLACYIILTYVADAVDAAPYLHVTGPWGSGKTQAVLVLLIDLVFQPLAASDVSAPVIFRMLDAYGGTMVLDEAEKLNNRSEKSQEISGLFNAGHQKGFPARRCEKDRDKIVVREFDCYGPKVLASIKPLPDTLSSRCIPVPMLRRPKGLKPVSCDVDLAALRDDLHAVTLSHAVELRALLRSSDDMGLRNRTRDLWLPLIRIAGWLDQDGELQLLRCLRDYAERAAAKAEQKCGVPEEDRALLLELYSRVLQGTHVTTSPSELLTGVQSTHPRLFDYWSAVKVGQVLDNYGVESKNVRVGKNSWKQTYKDVKLDRLEATLDTYGVKPPGDQTGAPD